MNGLLLLVGRLAGAVGAIAVLVAVLMRLGGNFYLGTLSTGTLLQGGMAALLVACVCLLQVLVARNP
jgi:hypothetical protein